MKGTLIKTKTGHEKIENIKSGEVVYAWNEKTKQHSWRKVLNTFVRETNTIYKLTYQDGTQLETTWNHPFYIQDKGFVEAKSLVVGDLSVTAHGKSLMLVDIEIDNRVETVYNFEVEEDHTYFVSESELWVHNDAYSNKESIATQPNLTLSQIKERYDGLLNFTGLQERFSNLKNNLGFIKDYETDTGSFAIDKTMSAEQEKHLMDTMNSLSSSIRFERDTDGSLKMIQNNKTKEGFQITKDFLKELFLDRNFNINFMDNKKIKDKKGSIHIKSEDALSNIDNKSLADYNLADEKKQSFIFLDPDYDKNVRVWGKSDGNNEKINLPNDIVLLHELIHAYRYKNGVNIPIEEAFNVIKYNKNGKAIDPKIEYSVTQKEEIYTIGEGIRFNTEYYNNVLKIFEKSPSSKYTENQFRLERKLPIRLTYENIK